MVSSAISCLMGKKEQLEHDKHKAEVWENFKCQKKKTNDDPCGDFSLWAFRKKKTLFA